MFVIFDYKMKINPIYFCFLPVSRYLYAWLRYNPLLHIVSIKLSNGYYFAFIKKK